MRVYGSSPLFNYVELIFRSKRLFIVSIILASLATTGFYLFRAKSYNARMIVLMTGSEVLGTPDESARGTIRFKMDVLNIMVRDPNFIKQAMREEHLDQGKTELEFVEFCKAVNNSLTYSSDGGSILEISCHWPDATCEKIVKAFYSKYSSIVFDQETILTTTRADLLENLVKDYGEKQRELDNKVKAYQLKTIHDPALSFDTANNEWVQRDNEVKRLQSQLDNAQKQRVSIAAALQATPPTIRESTNYLGPGAAPEYAAAIQARDAAEKTLNDLKINHLDADPRVKHAQEEYDAAKAKADQLTKTASSTPNKGPAVSIRENSNPQYAALKTQLTDQDLTITSLQSSLATAISTRNALDQKARIAPEEALKFKYMTEDMGLYSNIHASLRGDLESARLTALRDTKTKAQEMKVMVQPEAEAEKGGSRGALMLAAGPLLGLLIAFCFSLLSESMDHSLRTPIEVEKHLGKPVLAVLPRMDANKKAARRQMASGDNRPSLPS